MRILIAEDDMASRKFLYQVLSAYGEFDLTVDGIEAVEAFMMAHKLNKPYDLVCLDIMMPRVDGIKALKAMRDIERQRGTPIEESAKVVIISPLNQTETVFDSPDTGREAYAVKPLNIDKLVAVLEGLGFCRKDQ